MKYNLIFKDIIYTNFVLFLNNFISLRNLIVDLVICSDIAILVHLNVKYQHIIILISINRLKC